MQVSEIREKIKQTNLEKYGFEVASKSLIVKEKSKETCLEKYGYVYSFQSENNKQKSEQTCLERYGVKNAGGAEIVLEKIKETKLQRYNNPYYTNVDKIHETLYNKYGEISYFGTTGFKEHMSYLFSLNIPQEKYKETCNKKYDCDFYTQTDEYKEKVKTTCNKKYGKDSYSQTDEYKEKVKTTCNKKYGKDSYSQTDECKEKVKTTCNKKYGADTYLHSEEGTKIVKSICNKKYGVQYAIQNPNIKQRVNETKRKNNTFNTSKCEDATYDFLMSKFSTVYRNYKSAEYPFNCDFYIKDINTYIEIQGSWTHGKHPYNENNNDDIEIVNKWKNKHTKYYDNAINVWTIRDVKKRNIAMENKLNFIEIFSANIDKIISELTVLLNL